ncbi:MAG TPA: DUF4178 domain-containing protein [Methylibium sp.]|nr:DUF4178 domain-containing protein [Methylibium sp.]
MATEPSPQRAYRAACPNCGAAVEFRSAASASAVCSFCRSTLVREGEALRRIGQSAELFDDHSPLQLGAAGRWQGAAFTLVGRLQLRYAGGYWNEWHALFDSGKSGWLSEDNGRHVIAFDAPLDVAPPAPAELQVGARVVVGRQGWQVASLTRAQVHAAQGELPGGPPAAGEYLVADLRNPQGEVGTLDYADLARPLWSIGREVELGALALTGLAGPAEKTLGARTVQCPSCGAAIEIKLAGTQSVSCGQCRAVVDVSGGVGADLKHYAQLTPGEDAEHGPPLIPLGRVGTLALGDGGPHPWQVVGYVERCTLPGGDDDEQFYWREYLLYHRVAGFAFIVDAEDGWSWVRPLTGAPEVRGATARWKGESYRETERYASRTTYVLGEFYWKLASGERTDHADYLGPAGRRLNREATGYSGHEEVTWSAGGPLEADQLIAVFRLGADRRAAMKRDVKPLSLPASLGSLSSGGGGGSIATWFVALLVFAFVVSMERCSDDDRCDELRLAYGDASNEYQQCLRSNGGGGGLFRGSGGSFGGFSTGGGHK